MENNIKKNNQEEEEGLDFRKLFLYLIGNIHWYIIAIIISLTLSFVITRYSTRVYQASTSVLISDNSQNSILNSNNGNNINLLSGFGMYPSLENFENQSIILESYSQVRRTIEKLDFDISYFNVGRIINQEIYNNAPFEVIIIRDSTQLINTEFHITINNNGNIDLELKDASGTLYNYAEDKLYRSVNDINITKQITPGEIVNTKYFHFYIRIKENFNPQAANRYFFVFNTPHQLTLKYQGRLAQEPMAKGASMLRLSVTDTNPQKAAAFLNKLTEEYIKRNLENKNEIANNTIEFIESQIETISKSLSSVETDLKNFRSKNSIMDLSFQSKQILEQLKELESQKLAIDMQNQYYTYLLNYIKENQNTESIMAPSTIGVNDPLLSQLILEINQLSVQKSSLTNIKQGTNIGSVQKIDAQLQNAKLNMYENASNLVKSTQISLNEINDKIRELSSEVNKLPETERQLFNIKRKYQLNDNLYTYLLERRAEAQIAKASNTSDNEIIDKALVNYGPIKPRKKTNLLIALFFAFAIPTIYIFLKETLNSKIDSPDTIKKITQRPIIGYIPNSGETSNVKISDAPNSPWSEAFRIVRSKLQFTTSNISSPILLVTSSIPSEGKSFIAINIAIANAIAGKKTVLVGLDLRRPQIAQRFGLDKNIGVTNHLIGEAELDDIIQKSDNPNLDIITSGIIPPNPAELIANNKTKKLLDTLKEKYDYIVLDTAPMSPVSDSHHIANFADSIIFVVRDRYTHKQIFQTSIEEFDNNNINNVSIVINDILLKQRRASYKYGYSYGYKYGYKYGYGYGYGYYSDKKHKKHKF